MVMIKRFAKSHTSLLAVALKFLDEVLLLRYRSSLPTGKLAMCLASSGRSRKNHDSTQGRKLYRWLLQRVASIVRRPRKAFT